MVIRTIVWLGALACATIQAQDLARDWQGIGKAGGQDRRLIVHFEKGENGTWKATLARIDVVQDWVLRTRSNLLPSSGMSSWRCSIGEDRADHWF